MVRGLGHTFADVLRVTTKQARDAIKAKHLAYAKEAYQAASKRLLEHAENGFDCLNVRVEHRDFVSGNTDAVREVGNLLTEMLVKDGFNVLERNSDESRFLVVSWPEKEGE